MPSNHCFFADFPGAGVCDGRLVKCHLLPRRLLKLEFRYGIGGSRGVPHFLVDVWPAGRSKSLRALVADPRCWVWGCGGIVGSGGHHGQLDHARTLKIPREYLPRGIEEFAHELGLTWWLDREYGERCAGVCV